MWVTTSTSRNNSNSSTNSNSNSNNDRRCRRMISPLQGKGMMLLALVLFTESVTLTKAVRTVEAFGGGGSGASAASASASASTASSNNGGALQQQESCINTGGAAASAADRCGEFNRCTLKYPRALEECALQVVQQVPRGGQSHTSTVAGAAVEAAAAAATAAVANTKMPYNIPLNGWKIIFQAFLTTINVACWLIPLRSKSFGENKLALSLANAFSGGVFLSLAFGHLIPECVHGFAEGVSLGQYNEATPYMLVLSGYLLIFFVEKVAFDAHEIMHEMEHAQDNIVAAAPPSSSSSSSKGATKAAAKKTAVVANGKSNNNDANANAAVKNTGRSAVILLAALAVHSILEMMALGLSDSFSDSAVLTISIALHQPAESIALLVAFLKSGMPKAQIITFLSIFSAMGPIGVALGIVVNEFAAPIVDAIMLAVVAGTFVYVGATEVIPEEWEDSEHKWKKFFALMGGIGSIFAITQYTMTLGV